MQSITDRLSRLFITFISTFYNDTNLLSDKPNSTLLTDSSFTNQTTGTTFLRNSQQIDQLEESEFSVPSWVFVIMTTLYVCIFISGIAGNLLVILVIAKDRRMRTTANFYLISLSVADLMIIAFCLPVAVYELHAEEVWDLGPVLCKLAPLLQYLSTNASISTMVAISIERYIVVCRPLKIRTYCTTGRAFGLIIVIWLFSLACSSPLLYFTVHEKDYHHKLKREVYVCFINHLSNEAYFYFHQLCFYVLPGILLSILYSRIVFTLRRFKNERFGHSPDSRKNTGPGSKSQSDTKQLIIMLSAVVLSYFVCLLPYNCVTFLSLVSHETLADLGPLGYNLFLAISRIMFFVNSCSNPIMYNAISGKFRDAFKKFFCPKRFKGLGLNSRTLSVRSVRVTGEDDYLLKNRLRLTLDMENNSIIKNGQTGYNTLMVRRTYSHNVDTDKEWSPIMNRSIKSDSFRPRQVSLSKLENKSNLSPDLNAFNVRTHRKRAGEVDV